MGCINGVAYDKFAYLTNMASDIQAQINTKAKTTTLSSYAPLASSIFTGSIYNIPIVTINYISGLISDAQTQINAKSNKLI